MGRAASHVSGCTCGCLTSWVFNTLQNTCLCVQTVCPPAITFCLEVQSSSDIFTQHFKCSSWPQRLLQLSPFSPVIFHFGFPSISEQPALYVKCVFVFTALYLCRTFFDQEIVFSLRTALLHAASWVSVSLPCLPVSHTLPAGLLTTA